MKNYRAVYLEEYVAENSNPIELIRTLVSMFPVLESKVSIRDLDENEFIHSKLYSKLSKWADRQYLIDNPFVFRFPREQSDMNDNDETEFDL